MRCLASGPGAGTDSRPGDRERDLVPPDFARGCLVRLSTPWSIWTAPRFQILDPYCAERVYIRFAAGSSANPFRGGIIRRARFGRRCSKTLGCGPRDFGCLSRFDHPATSRCAGWFFFRDPRTGPARAPGLRFMDRPGQRKRHPGRPRSGGGVAAAAPIRARRNPPCACRSSRGRRPRCRTAP